MWSNILYSISLTFLYLGSLWRNLTNTKFNVQGCWEEWIRKCIKDTIRDQCCEIAGNATPCDIDTPCGGQFMSCLFHSYLDPCQWAWKAAAKIGLSAWVSDSCGRYICGRGDMKETSGSCFGLAQTQPWAIVAIWRVYQYMQDISVSSPFLVTLTFT